MQSFSPLDAYIQVRSHTHNDYADWHYLLSATDGEGRRRSATVGIYSIGGGPKKGAPLGFHRRRQIPKPSYLGPSFTLLPKVFVSDS